MLDFEFSKNISRVEKYARDEDRLSETTKSVFEKKSDREIWDKFRQNDESAFIYIYSKYFKILFQYASQFTPDKGLIKDAIQDLFIEIRDKRSNLSSTNSIKFYLFKSIKRKVILHVKKSAKNKFSFDLDSGYNFELNFSHEYKLIETQLNDERNQQLNNCLVKLSSRQKEAIYYYFYQDMTYSDIMEIMNVKNIKSVRNLIYKALGVLKSVITLPS